MEQATVNLFADMGVQPTTLISGLVAATPSTDTTPPTSTITSPTAGANVQDGSQVTITGTATDSGGGVVAGVEVSTDGGTTWHPATIDGPDATDRQLDLHAGSPHGYAIDDDRDARRRRQRQPRDAVRRHHRSTSSCPCSLWGNRHARRPPTTGDPSSVEVGVKFQSDSLGTITGIRFYKAATNTGTHVGSLWTSSGQLLASATFTNETASGWQTVDVLQPGRRSRPTRPTSPAYFAPNGHYSGDAGLLLSGALAPPSRRRQLRQPAAARGAQHQPSANGAVHLQRSSARSRPARSRPPTTGSTSMFTPIARARAR